jgi:colanic acid/amylovoran biosynthesis protein
MEARILIMNSHSTNAGDVAILQAMLSQISRISPLFKITVHCSDPERSCGLFPDPSVGFRAYPAPFFHDAPSITQLLSAGFVFINNLASAALFRLFRFRFFLFNRAYKESMEDFFACDVAISAGGGFISSDYGFFRPYTDLVMAKLLGKRLVLYSQSIGPFNGFLSRLISRIVLGSADLIILREERSRSELESIGVKNCPVTADLAFAFPYEPRKKAGQKQVVLCPRRWTFQDRGRSDSYLAFLSSLAGRISSLGFKIVVLPSSDDDLPIHALLKMPQGTEFIGRVLPPAEMADLLSESEFLVSSRMHPIILGALSGTPFFAVGWEYKLEELCKALGFERLCQSAASADGGTEKRILEAIASREDIRKSLKSSVPSMKRLAEKNSELLEAKLKEWGCI